MDGGAGLLVQSGLLANPVEDMPVQRAVVVQEGLQLQQEECEKDERYTGEEGRRGSVFRCSSCNHEICLINLICLMII